MQSIKDDFKGFINELSTTIIKDVIYSDMKELHSKFETTNKSLVNLAAGFTLDMDKVHEQAMTSQELINAIATVNILQAKLSKLLQDTTTFMQVDAHKILTDSLEKNQLLHKEYQRQVGIINDKERKKYEEIIFSSFTDAKNGLIVEIKGDIESKVDEMKKDNEEINRFLRDLWIENSNTRTEFVDNIKRMTDIMYKVLNAQIQRSESQVQDLKNYTENMESRLLHSMKRQSRILNFLNLIFGSIVVISGIALYFKYKGIL